MRRAAQISDYRAKYRPVLLRAPIPRCLAMTSSQAQPQRRFGPCRLRRAGTVPTIFRSFALQLSRHGPRTARRCPAQNPKRIDPLKGPGLATSTVEVYRELPAALHAEIIGTLSEHLETDSTTFRGFVRDTITKTKAKTRLKLGPRRSLIFGGIASGLCLVGSRLRHNGLAGAGFLCAGFLCAGPLGTERALRSTGARLVRSGDLSGC